MKLRFRPSSRSQEGAVQHPGLLNPERVIPAALASIRAVGHAHIQKDRQWLPSFWASKTLSGEQDTGHRSQRPAIPLDDTLAGAAEAGATLRI